MSEGINQRGTMSVLWFYELFALMKVCVCAGGGGQVSDIRAIEVSHT